ncbi:unnamed protein product [Lepeophtheirus salmonis]|uniref:(salmon louse) hypothetical protein n=1 Tax=Lepeophtheirus salmonis TaxID=72036 RepID=A0A7R8CT74_LEPSM|nr:unnamed protein product [Lepeophtheirus salmonis]CAF2886023.1 unnamed protein product [Lepeophtheirus salmonis]
MLEKKLQEEVTTLKFTNEDNKRKIKSMEGEIDKLTLQNRSKESAIESLSSNPIIKDLKNQLSDTERKLTAKTENAAYLKKLLDEAGEEFLEKDENESKLIEAQKSLKTELAQVKIALKDAHDEYSVLIKESNNRQEEYESIDELLYACRKENSEIVSKNKKISAELTKYKQIDNTSDSKEDASVVDNLRKRLDTTSSEVDGLLIKLNKTRQLYEDQGKILKKVEEEKNRLEKDLNDEIETLRRSKIKIESSEHEKKNLLSDKEIEIQKLEKEIKNLIQKGVANQQSLEHNSKEIEILRSDASEKQNIIENLEVQIKSSQKEDNVIKILRKELKLKEYELSKKEAIIREVELKLEKSLYDGEVEDLPRDEIESLKRDVIQANAYHSKEFDKIKKANEKVINEYKDANKELQKQVGICSNRDTADDSSQLVHQQMNESDQSFKIDSSILPTELQASGKKKRRGKVRNTQNNSTKCNNSSSILVNESNVENELNDSENSVSRSQKSNKVTRSRPVHKTKKKNVNDVDRSSISELSSVEKERNTLKETHSFEFLHSGTENTPRRSNRTTNNNNFRQYEVLKSLENLTEIEEEEERASQSFVGKRQLRTRKKSNQFSIHAQRNSVAQSGVTAGSEVISAIALAVLLCTAGHISNEDIIFIGCITVSIEKLTQSGLGAEGRNIVKQLGSPHSASALEAHGSDVHEYLNTYIPSRPPSLWHIVTVLQSLSNNLIAPHSSLTDLQDKLSSIQHLTTAEIAILLGSKESIGKFMDKRLFASRKIKASTQNKVRNYFSWDCH